jgi:hypothetical protein
MTDTQVSAGYIDLDVMGEIGEAVEDAEQFLIPGPAQALCTWSAEMRVHP